MTYTQCTLKRTPEQGSVVVTVSWIPTKFAVLGTTIKLRNDDGEWVDGWSVEGIGAVLPEDMVPDPHRDIKAHRKSTGDALPKKKD